jgi:hypothetical protein
MTDTTTITIITTSAVARVSAAEWARDDSGDVHFYESDGDAETVATVDSESFVAAVRGHPAVFAPESADRTE